jgi:UDP-glucose 4-epimerase
MSKKVLILGGAGFIGFNIAKWLSQHRDYQITIADNFMKKNRDEEFDELIKKNNIKLIEDDFSYPGAYDKLDTDYDQVYMMAALVGVDNANSKTHEVIRVNTRLSLSTRWNGSVAPPLGKYCLLRRVNVMQERSMRLDTPFPPRKKFH